ncbi:MAG: FkbM family methyltransferase [Actinomycetota bacterium]
MQSRTDADDTIDDTSETTADRHPPGDLERLRPTFFADQLADPTDVFFVNIGANDGVENDPIFESLQFYGWSGLAVEPNPATAELLRANMRGFDGVEVTTTAIGERSERQEFFTIPAERAGPDPAWASQVCSLSRSYVHDAIGNVRAIGNYDLPDDLESHIESTVVEVSSLPDLLRRHDVARVDVINIDTEGYNAIVFRQLDLERWAPAVIVLEFADMTDAEQTEAVARLVDAGYERTRFFGWWSWVYTRTNPPRPA